MIKKFLNISLLLFLLSCDRDVSKPHVRLFPDMYDSEAYEPYAPFGGKSSSFVPVEGTVARGHDLYPYSDSNEGYQKAKKYLKSDFLANEIDFKKGKRLFGIYCVACHGEKGDGQGILVQRGKYFGVPSYGDRDLTEGSIYHVIYYGRNIMGSHASQLNEQERWQVVHYVEFLRQSLLKK